MDISGILRRSFRDCGGVKNIISLAMNRNPCVRIIMRSNP